jgi:hypothetical protein
MKLKPILQIAQNLFLVGNRVISYETHVATVEFYPKELGRRPKLVSLGKWSRTTGKHIQRVRQLLDATFIESKERHAFYQFELGAKCQIPGSISPAGSAPVFEAMRSGNPLDVALAMAAPSMSKRDLTILHSMAQDLPDLQARIERIQFLAAKGLAGLPSNC